ncbi:HK97 family phage prohead protease [Novosphingobium indicum]|nr:HK97 family phage prohead protease [Novosphingobium indicum]
MATLTRSGIDEAARTVELSFSSETDTVVHSWGVEILGHGPGEADLSRLQNGAPLLWSHDHKDQRGVVESARIDGDRVGRAVVRFSRSPEGERLFQDVLSGIVTKVSVGYRVTGLEYVGERDDLPIYRVTWEASEISMVSVPADDTVGVGRTMEKPQEEGAAHRRNMTLMAAQASEPTNRLQSVLDSARTAPGDIMIFNDDGSVRGTHKRPAAAMDIGSIRQWDVPAFAGDPLRLVHEAMPTGREAGKSTKIDAALLNGSLCRAAGAKLIVVPSASEGKVVGGELVFQRKDIRFDVVQPTEFTRVTDGDEIAVSELPIDRQAVDLDYMPTYAVRIELSRQEQKQYAEGQLAASAMASITMGLARAADFVLLQTILWNNPEAFSLSKAAEAGLRFQELRAVVGTSANNAVIGPNGRLIAFADKSTVAGTDGELIELPLPAPSTGGIEAELTDTMTETVVGAFGNSAIAIHEDIRMLADRRNVNGDLALTVFANMEALLPRTDVFWTLGG